ncbi:hypothetical protein DRQ23_01925 [bacterium]|nr:MAG: hypothetical protein DRQ23_01925 [bacterium]
MRKSGLLTLVTILFIVGCSSNINLTNKAPAPKFLRVYPYIDFNLNPEDFLPQNPVVFVSPAELTHSPSINITSFLLKKIIESMLEFKGYQITNDSLKANMIVDFFWTISKEQVYVPPRLDTYYRWIPPSTYKLNFDSKTQYYNFGSSSGYSSTTGNAELTTPGYLKKEYAYRPGYTTTVAKPFLFLGIRKKTSKNVPLFTFIGFTKTTFTSPLIPLQSIVFKIGEKIPDRGFKYYKSLLDTLKIQFMILSGNGEEIFPVVTRLDKNYSGLKIYDFLIEVNGISLKDKTYSEVLSIMNKLYTQSDTVLLKVFHINGKLETVTLKRISTHYYH